MAEHSKFSPQTRKKLGHYVYALFNPNATSDNSKALFYVGKGQDDRCYAHAEGQENSRDFPKKLGNADLKVEVINQILKTGNKPTVKIIAHGLPNEESAFQIESILLGFLDLTNKQAGHKAEKYWLTDNQLEELYGTPVKRSELPGTVLLVGLNKTYPGARKDAQLLRNATLGDWNVGEDRAKAVDYVIGVYRGLMVSFFCTKKNESGDAIIEETNRDTRQYRQHRRFRWEGESVPEFENKYLNRSLASSEPNSGSNSLTTMPRGAGYRYLPKL